MYMLEFTDILPWFMYAPDSEYMYFKMSQRNKCSRSKICNGLGSTYVFPHVCVVTVTCTYH